MNDALSQVLKTQQEWLQSPNCKIRFLGILPISLALDSLELKLNVEDLHHDDDSCHPDKRLP